MKRLFQVGTSVSGAPMFFENKGIAKAYRDAEEKLGHFTWVRLGPDHWRYGLKGNPRTHSHNAKSGGHGTGFPKKPRK